MSTALIISIFNPHPRTSTHWRSMIDFWIKCSQKWATEIDTAYINLAGCGDLFNHEDFPFKNVKLFHIDGSHWGIFNTIVPQITEDNILMIDHDAYIYDDMIFTHAKNSLANGYDAFTILDNSGSVDIFPANEDRDIRRRIVPYLCFIKREWFDKIKPFDFTPIDGIYDSMGKITNQLVHHGLKIKEIPDDRSTLRLEDDFSISKDKWLDSPAFKWSANSTESNDYGYYHVRNAVLGVQLMNEYGTDAYINRKSITPFSEMMRSLAWWYFFDKQNNTLEQYQHMYINVLDDYGVPLDIWSKYMKEFYNYHKGVIYG